MQCSELKQSIQVSCVSFYTAANKVFSLATVVLTINLKTFKIYLCYL